MKIVFTLCSNNYLAQAKVLMDSVAKYAPDYQTFIGLVDKKNEAIDYRFWEPSQILEAEGIGIDNFEELWKRYTIIELNTCVKPFFIQYFFQQYGDVQEVIYLDPDTRLFHDLSEISQTLQQADVLITPHILSPIPVDDFLPFENLFLNYGIYNLGFIAVKPTANTYQFLAWWAERTRKFGYIQEAKGIFVDQLWINLVPLFFQNIHISRHLGLNMAPWNLHERRLQAKPEQENAYWVNQNQHLVFYHFSNYKPTQPDLPFARYTRYSFQNRPDLMPLYQLYHQEVMQNRYEILSKIPCAYVEMRNQFLKEIEQQQFNALPWTKRWWRKFKKLISK